MGKSAFFFFLLLPLLVLAQDDEEEGPEKFVDRASGLVIVLPDGWDRDTSREQGAIKFAGRLDVARGKYVFFQVETGPAQDFDEAAWFKREERSLQKALAKVSVPFGKIPLRVAGRDAAAFRMAGSVEPENGKPYTLRVRGAGVVNGAVFFRIIELSYNNAHEGRDRDLEAMWSAVAFEEPDLLGGGDEGGMGAGEDALGEPKPLEDQAANYKLVVPPGWEIRRDVPVDGDAALRVVISRTNAEGQGLVSISFWRFMSTRAETFSLESPGDVLQDYVRGNGLIDPFYGEGASKVLRPDVREDRELGDAEKVARFEYRNHTLKEEKEIREAEDLKRRGEKIEVPNPPKTVVRGRVALISPNIYFVFAHFARPVGDNEELVAEYEKVLESFQFLVSEAVPPPLRMGPEVLTNTLEEFKTERKKQQRVLSLSGRRTYKLQVDYTLPAGFKLFDKNLGANALLVVAAQDDKNNWVKIEIAAENANRIGEQNKVFEDKQVALESWRSNWESKAVGAKFPSKPQKFSLGRLRGKGYKKLTGTVENFPGTFTGCLIDGKSGWRIWATLETRGRGDTVFEKQIKTFFKSIRLKPIKR